METGDILVFLAHVEGMADIYREPACGFTDSFKKLSILNLFLKLFVQFKLLPVEHLNKQCCGSELKYSHPDLGAFFANSDSDAIYCKI